MSEAKLPVSLVEKMKKSPGGISPELDKLRNDFMLTVDFDGKNVKLKCGSYELIDIVIYSLEQKFGFTESFDEFIGVMNDKQIRWQITDENAWKICNLFQEDVQNLQAMENVKVKVFNESKYKTRPESVTVTCTEKNLEKVSKILKGFKEKCKFVIHHYEVVEAKYVAKAVPFCEQKFESAFCYFKKTEDLLNIYAVDKSKLDKVIGKWKDTISNAKQSDQFNLHVTTRWLDEPSDVETETASNHSDGETNMKNSVKQKSGQSPSVVDTDSSKQMEASEPDKGTALAQSRANMSTTAFFKPEPGRKSKDGKRYEFQSRKMKVFVYKESVTEIKNMNAIVNAANERMMHGGGVAYYISKAAGKKMDAECNAHIQRYGNLKVTENFVSSAGDMKCDGIIHAVGPQWHDYRGRRAECAKDVYNTILNCIHATEKRKWKRLALVAISSGIYGVPKKLCAEMYIKAIMDSGHNDPGSIEEIHFIDITHEILDLVETAHREWIKNPKSISFDNALQYPDAPSHFGKTTMRSKDPPAGLAVPQHPKPSVQYKKMFKDGVHYNVHGVLEVYVYTGSILELKNVDALVCSMDAEFNGYLLRKIMEKAGRKIQEQHKKACQKSHGRCRDNEVFIFPGGNLKVRQIVVIAIEHYITQTSARDLARLNEYYINITREADRENIARLALPVVGCAFVQDKRSCCKQIIRTAIRLCEDAVKSGQGSSIRELHLVNMDPDFTRYLVAALEEAERLNYRADNPLADEYEHETFSQVKWIPHERLPEVEVKPPKKQPEEKIKSLKISVKESVDCHYIETCKRKAETRLDCGHAFCKVCAIQNSSKAGCKICLTKKKDVKAESRLGISRSGKKCPVCLEVFPSLDTLPCSHELCKNCLDEIKVRKPTCPICHSVFGIITGNQPDGKMYYRTVDGSLPGYESQKTIEICYQFPDGIQKENHPNPRRRYKGTERMAYLPDNPEGRKVLHLLRRSFDRRLTFTVGDSRTTGKEDRVTYNDIHHKTKKHGGAQNYGYPDPGYLQRVQSELRDKGVTE